MVAATTSAPKSPKAPKALKAKKASTAHPPFAKMIIEAIASLKEKGGSSRQAILKYIKNHYKVDEKIAEVNVRRVLVSATAAGKLVRVKGAGASGSFKISQKAEKPKAAVKKVKKTVSKPKGTPVKKASTAKQTPSKPKKAVSVSKPKKIVAKKPKKPAVKKTPKKAPSVKK
nr:Histone H1 delta [Hymenolepis microstoma]